MQPLLDVRYLTVRFGDRRITVVDRVSLSLAPRRTLGIVGESGCGKTTLARAVLGLIPAEGEVRLEGVDVLRARGAQLRQIRRNMQIVFQDPFSSLNPRHTIERIVGEGLDVHERLSAAPRRARVRDMLARVGLADAFLPRYPHELSGGQRQRVAIARALVLRPRLVVCDEPVSALDVSVQSQILNLLLDLQAELGLSYVFIGHHLGVVRQVCDDVAVMYLGRIVEYGPADVVLNAPRHPYTQALLAAVLEPGAPAGLPSLPGGEAVTAASRPAGCAYHPRCPYAVDRCRADNPDLEVLGSEEVACWRAQELREAAARSVSLPVANR